jgi:hypothetical protein
MHVSMETTRVQLIADMYGMIQSKETVRCYF